MHLKLSYQEDKEILEDFLNDQINRNILYLLVNLHSVIFANSNVSSNFKSQFIKREMQSFDSCWLQSYLERHNFFDEFCITCSMGIFTFEPRNQLLSSSSRIKNSLEDPDTEIQYNGGLESIQGTSNFKITPQTIRFLLEKNYQLNYSQVAISQRISHLRGAVCRKNREIFHEFLVPVDNSSSKITTTDLVRKTFYFLHEEVIEVLLSLDNFNLTVLFFQRYNRILIAIQELSSKAKNFLGQMGDNLTAIRLQREIKKAMDRKLRNKGLLFTKFQSSRKKIENILIENRNSATLLKDLIDIEDTQTEKFFPLDFRLAFEDHSNLDNLNWLISVGSLLLSLYILNKIKGLLKSELDKINFESITARFNLIREIIAVEESKQSVNFLLETLNDLLSFTKSFIEFKTAEELLTVYYNYNKACYRS